MWRPGAAPSSPPPTPSTAPGRPAAVLIPIPAQSSQGDLGVRRTLSHLCLLALRSRALAKSRQLQLGLGILMPGSWMETHSWKPRADRAPCKLGAAGIQEEW